MFILQLRINNLQGGEVFMDDPGSPSPIVLNEVENVMDYFY